jgi:hypothetical protein
MQPIEYPFLPFYTVTMDFIVALPATLNGYDCILTITDKAIKAIKLIPGVSGKHGDADDPNKPDVVPGDAQYWAIRFWDYVVCEWGLPKTIINDRDGRFLSKFWRALFLKADVRLAMTTAYHPQADGRSEKANQTVEITLR